MTPNCFWPQFFGNHNLYWNQNLFLTEICFDRKFSLRYFFFVFFSLNLWLIIFLPSNSFILNFFWRKQKVLEPMLLWTKNFSNEKWSSRFWLLNTLSPVGTWKTWNLSVAMLSLTCPLFLFSYLIYVISYPWTITPNP